METNTSWIDAQKRAYIFWTNSHLPVNLKVKDLLIDFKDGLKLICLSENLTNSELGVRYQKNPVTNIHYIENINIALRFLAQKSQLKLSGYAAEDFIGENEKSILGFLWTILRYFMKFKSPVDHLDDSKSRKIPFEKKLLMWVKETICEYNLPIDRFNTAFRDGRALLALIHKYDPCLLKSEEVQDTRDPEGNIKKALGLANQHIPIPNILNVSDVLRGENENALILYLSLIKESFSKRLNIQLSYEHTLTIKESLFKSEEELDVLKSERDRLKNIGNELSDEKVNLENSNYDYQRKLDEVIEINESYKLEIDREKQYQESLRKRLEMLEEENVSNVKFIEECKERGKFLCKEVEELVGKREELGKILEFSNEDLEKENNDFRNQIRQLDSEKQEYQKKIHDLHLKALEKIEKNIFDHINQLNYWMPVIESNKTSKRRSKENKINELHASGDLERIEELSKYISTQNLRFKKFLVKYCVDEGNGLVENKKKSNPKNLRKDRKKCNRSEIKSNKIEIR